MTHEEAIAELDKCKGNVEALEMAREALETICKYLYVLDKLNTPTKPGRGMDGYYYCPTCGKMLQDGNDDERESECSRCRQAIKWSEENEK